MDADASRETARDLTVVIPTVGRPVLARCLEAIAAGAAWPAGVVVVDQGRDPGTATAIAGANGRGLACEHVVSRQRGAAAARNRGLERVATSFVAMVDDDCLPDEDWLTRMAARLRADPEAVVTGQVLPVGPDGSAPSLVDAPEPQTYTEPLLAKDVLYTGNMGTAMDVVARVGPFDEAPVLRNGAEDNEWAYRAQRAGVAIHYDPTIRVRHLDWRTPSQLAAVERRYARGQGGFYGLHLRRGDRWVARRTVFDLARHLRRAGRSLAEGDRVTARRRLAAAVEMARGIVAGLVSRPR